MVYSDFPSVRAEFWLLVDMFHRNRLAAQMHHWNEAQRAAGESGASVSVSINRESLLAKVATDHPRPRKECELCRGTVLEFVALTIDLAIDTYVFRQQRWKLQKNWKKSSCKRWKDITNTQWPSMPGRKLHLQKPVTPKARHLGPQRRRCLQVLPP